MTTPAAALFRRCGIALFGPDPIWKAPLGVALGVKTDTVDAWAKGTSRIPPKVWPEVYGLLIKRQIEIQRTHAEVLALTATIPDLQFGDRRSDA